tara:strand:+ start:2882 stop:3889 length:1008 start_codon:yes stop_codon:yes gene_type:complete
MKPIYSDHKINYTALIEFFKYNSFYYLKFSVLTVLIYFIYFLFKSPVYETSVSFYTNYSDSNNYSFISSIVPGASADSGSLKFSIDHYLKSEKLLNDVVEKEFVINNEKTNLVDYWNSGKTSFFSKLNPISILRKINYQIMFISDLTENDKQKQLAKIRVLNSISYSKDLMLSHHKIVLKDKDLTISKFMANSIFESLVSFSAEIENSKAKEKKVFIQERLLEVKSSLTASENDMLKFLKENDDHTSPLLALEKQRLQRNISLYSQLYLSLSDQLETAKIDENDKSSSIYTLDSPYISSFKSGIVFHKMILLILIVNFFIISIYKLFIDRSKLIQ